MTQGAMHCDVFELWQFVKESVKSNRYSNNDPNFSLNDFISF
jgi:hypothetical protein